MKTKTFRQGDILFIRVDKLPASKTKKPDGIIAYGEVTGHSHRIIGGELWESGKEMFVESHGEAIIKHEEHGVGAGPDNDIWNGELPRGIYQVIRQKEFTGSTDKIETRFVRD